jgi:hypothetical protein
MLTDTTDQVEIDVCQGRAAPVGQLTDYLVADPADVVPRHLSSERRRATCVGISPVVKTFAVKDNTISRSRSIPLNTVFDRVHCRELPLPRPTG